MIVAFTLPAMGHTKPMLPLLSGLVRKGQKIVCYGHGTFEADIKSTGAEFRPYPELDYDVDAPDFNLIKMAANLIHASELICRMLTSDVEALRPRIILQDSMALWGSRIGTALNIPRVHTIPTLVFNTETQWEMCKEDGPVKLLGDIARGAPPLLWQKIRSRFAITTQEAFGLERAWQHLDPPVCELVFSIEELQTGTSHGPVPRHFIGPTIDADCTFHEPVETGYVLVTFGTLSNTDTRRYESAMRGSVHAGFSVVVLCGNKVDRRRLDTVAAELAAAHRDRTITVLERVPDVEPLIRDAALVVHHAGMATTWETIHYNKPAVFIPTIADQKVLASQLEKNGLGKRLPRGREFDPHAITGAIKAAYGHTYPWKEMKGWLERAGGASAGIEKISDVLRSVAP